jgi:hypothetical protein
VERLTVTAPASFDDCLEAAAPSRFIRQAQILMRLKSDTLAIRDGDALLAVAYLWPHSDSERELCLALRPAARPHLVALCRFAHLTLSRLAHAGITVSARVSPGHRAGERMARLVGMSPDPSSSGLWMIKGIVDDASGRTAVRRRSEQGGSARGGPEPRIATHRE